jgi:two-component system sensor histidine kinase DesK
MSASNVDSTVRLSWQRIRLFVAGYLFMYPLPWIAHAPTPRGLLWSALGIAVFLPLYFHGYGQSGWRRLAYAWIFLGIGILLQPYGGMWMVFPVYACAQAGFSRPLRIAATGLASVLAGLALLSRLLGVDWDDLLFGELICVIVGFCAVFMATINSRNDALARSREEARQLAVVAERERIARDLHDVLGHTLTLIAVKADLARKLMERDADAARREVEEIHQSARSALADVRAAVSGMRSTTLATELEQARRALASAGIACTGAAAPATLPPRVDVALGYVLREATTNVIRHSAARSCRIELQLDGQAVRLQVQDDGHGGAPGGGITPGHGLKGMQQRLAAVGGTLSFEAPQPAPGGMCLRARVPLGEEAPA